MAALARAVRERLRGRDLALIAAGLTFYAGLAVVPLLVVAIALTAHLTPPETVVRLGDRLVDLLPGAVGAPAAAARLVDAGVNLSPWGGLLALLPMSLYGEGLRRALLRFTRQQDSLTGWRGRLLALPLLLLTPLVLYPLLLAARAMAGLQEDGHHLASVAVGFYSVLAGRTVPLLWGFRVVAAGRIGWRAAGGRPVHGRVLSGFLQGFVLFLSLPLDLGAPFGGLTVVGGVVAVGRWLFLRHLVLLAGWLLTQALDERRRT